MSERSFRVELRVEISYYYSYFSLFSRQICRSGISKTSFFIVQNFSLLDKLSKSTVLIHIFTFLSLMTLTPGQIQGHKKIFFSSDSDVLYTQKSYASGDYKNVTLTLKFQMTLIWEASKVQFFKCLFLS